MIDNRNLFSSNTNVDKTCHSHEGEGAAEFLTLRKNKLPTTEREGVGGKNSVHTLSNQSS